jgi:hypothetical protein
MSHENAIYFNIPARDFVVQRAGNFSETSKPPETVKRVIGVVCFKAACSVKG